MTTLPEAVYAIRKWRCEADKLPQTRNKKQNCKNIAAKCNVLLWVEFWNRIRLLN